MIGFDGAGKMPLATALVFSEPCWMFPQKITGHYTELMHLTTGIMGPEPQRIVVGSGGEMLYTASRYKNLIPIEDLDL